MVLKSRVMCLGQVFSTGFRVNGFEFTVLVSVLVSDFVSGVRA